jgi:tetratricopeptide (TPR) repeat protein
MTAKEKKAAREREALEAASGAKAGAKDKGKKKTPKELQEEEERRKKEEEEKSQAGEGETEELIPPGQPASMCKLDVTQDGVLQLGELADNKMPLIFRFRRCLRPGVPAEWADVNEQRYRAEVRLDLDPFLEPGRTFHEYTVLLEPEFTDPSPEMTSPAGKGKQKPAKPKKGKTDLPPTLAVEEENVGPHPYVEAGTQIHLCLQFAKPMVYLPEHRPRPEFKPTDIIPRRIKPVRKPMDCVKAYSAELKSIVLALVEEWREQGGTTEGDQEKVKENFLTALQSKGLAASYKEKLKHCIIKIVKEKFSVKSDESQNTMMVFYNELYVYLLDLMHRTINDMFSRGAVALEPFEAEENKPESKWKRLAEEAEENGDFGTAAKYHQERLVHESEEPGVDLQTPWYEYGEFLVRARDPAKAEQSFKEAIAIDINNLPSLIAYGLLLLSKKLYAEAEVFLQAAVDVDVEAVLPWSCLGLFMEVAGEVEQDPYRQKERQKEAAYSYNQAKRLLHLKDPDSPGIYQYLAEFLLGLCFEQLADHCLTQEVNRVGKATISCMLLLGQLYYQQEHWEKAVVTLKQVLAQQKDNVKACLLLGDVYRKQKRIEEAADMYDKAIELQGEDVPGKVYVRLGRVQLELGRYDDARDNYLWGAKVWPCGLTWLGVGIAYYRLDDFAHAEQALNESNILDNLNPITWAYLCLRCLKAERPEEADFAFNQALKQNLRDPDLITEIGSEQMALGRVQLAVAAFRRSLKEEDRSSTHLLLANTLTQMRLFEEARAEYATVLALTESPNEQEEAMNQIKTIEQILA